MKRELALKPALVETLEQRLLLSVNVEAAVLDTPLFTVGNRWTYDDTANGSTATVFRTVIGYSLLTSGLKKWEIDTTAPGVTGAIKEFYGLDAAGDFVNYGQSANYSSYSTSDTYSPPLISLPAEIDQSTPYSSTTTDMYTRTDSSGVTTTGTSTKTSVATLASETPGNWEVPFGTYPAYQITTVSGPDTTVEYDSIQYGLLESDDNGGSAGVSSTLKLTNFEGNHDNLSFTNIPTAAVPAGQATQPAVTVEVRDNTGTLDTEATGSVTLTLASASRLGTSSGTLGGGTAAIVDGVATFSNLTVSAPGSYTLTANDTAGDTAAISNPFSVAGSLPLSLTPYGVNAKGANSGDTIRFKLLVSPKKTIDTQQLVVTLPAGFAATGANGGGVASGNTVTWTSSTVRLVDFNVVVPNPTIVNGLTNFVVSAVDDVTYSDGTTDEGTANSTILLAAPHLEVKVAPPRTVDVFDPIPLTIELVNSKGKVDTGENTAQVQLTLNTITDGEGAVLQNTTIATFNAGVATFPESAAPIINGGGTFTLTATEIGASIPSAPVETKKFVVLPYTLRPHPGPTFNKEFLAERGQQIVSGNGDTTYNAYYLDLYTPQGKRATFTQDLTSELPGLHYSVIPVGPGTAVDTSFAGLAGNNISLGDEIAAGNPVVYSTSSSGFLEFEFPGSYRLQFDPIVPSYLGAANINAAPSAIKPFTTPLLKVVDPVIVAKTSARVVAVGDTFSVSAHPDFLDPDHHIFTQNYTGIQFQLLGTGSVETYTQALPFDGDATLELTIHTPGRYRLVLSVVYSPGDPSQPFSSLDYLPADGLESLTIPIVVTK